ncbi:SDR family oxidoreductase [Streptomyces malaysiensis]|uniref:SDR family oxidoreductase n=1 Tax=Streptomyces malaysiensis TaxID=92644 RepID=UPI002B2A65A4|nr:SDR family oxidoreductase [Streptomyces malaysiensis]
MNVEMRADEELLQKILRAIQARRFAHPDELSTWIVALAGPASDFMTGEVIVIDGGQSVSWPHSSKAGSDMGEYHSPTTRSARSPSRPGASSRAR